MRPLRALGIYIAVVFIGGALLAPWLYWFAQTFGQAFPKLANKPFQLYVTRSLMIMAVVGLWPLLRALGATSLREVGLTNPTTHRKSLMSGIVLGLCSLAVVAIVALVAGARSFESDHSTRYVMRRLMEAVFTAAVVAVMEEVLFRGGIFGGLRRVLDWRSALLISSLIYAITHFLADAEFSGAVTWYSGLELLPRMLGGLWNWKLLMPSLLNLTLAGLLLGLMYQRTGNLWFSIGMHAGWVFWLVSYRSFTQSIPADAIWFWGTNKMVDGWLATIALLVTLALLTFLPLARRKSPA